MRAIWISLSLLASVGSPLCLHAADAPARSPAEVLVQEENIPQDGRGHVWLLQDVHVDASAQWAWVRFLEQRPTQGKVLVIHEGLSARANPEIYSSLAPPQYIEPLAASFLERGLFTGPEYFAIANPGRAEIVGAEDRDLYLEHYRAARGVDSSDHLPRLDRLLSALRDRERKSYPPEMIEYARLRGIVHGASADDAALRSFIDLLARMAPQSEGDFPNLFRLAEAYRLQERVRTADLRGETGALNRRLAEGGIGGGPLRMPGPAEGTGAWLAAWEAVRSAWADADARYPGLAAYAGLLRAMQDVRMNALPAEMEACERFVERSKLGQSEAGRLAAAVRALEVARDAAAMELPRYRHPYLEGALAQLREGGIGGVPGAAPEEGGIGGVPGADPEEGGVGGVPGRHVPAASGSLARLEEGGIGGVPGAAPEEGGIGGVPGLLPVADRAVLASLAPALSAAESYYDLAFRRDAAMSRRTLAALSGDPARDAVVFIGGFHAPAVAAALRSEGYGVSTVTAQADADKGRYKRMLRDRFAPSAAALILPPLTDQQALRQGDPPDALLGLSAFLAELHAVYPLSESRLRAWLARYPELSDAGLRLQGGVLLRQVGDGPPEIIFAPPAAAPRPELELRIEPHLRNLRRSRQQARVMPAVPAGASAGGRPLGLAFKRV